MTHEITINHVEDTEEIEDRGARIWKTKKTYFASCSCGWVGTRYDWNWNAGSLRAEADAIDHDVEFVSDKERMARSL